MSRHVLPRQGVGLRAKGVTQQQSAQAKAPSVLIGIRQFRADAPRLALLGIQSPANASVAQPPVQLFHIGLAECIPITHGFDLEQTCPVAQTHAQLRQLQQRVHGLHQGVCARRAVGDGIRHVQLRR